MINNFTQQYIRKSFLITLFVIMCFLIPNVTKAASLSISPSTSNVTVGNVITVKVYVNTSGKTINNAEGVIQFEAESLEVVSVSKSSSIFTLWVEEPSFSNTKGRVTFNGGVPNPGFSGANGYIGSITFKAKKQGSTSVVFADGAVRENDGLGTNILTSTGQTLLTIIPTKEKVTTVPTPKTSPIPAKTEVIETPVPEVAMPIFTDYSTNVEEGEFVVIKGIADPLTSINIESDILTSKDGIIHQLRTVQSDSKGAFVYVSDNRASSGVYTITAFAQNKDGIVSEKAPPIQISISHKNRENEVVSNNSFLQKNSFSIILSLIGLIIILILIMILGFKISVHKKTR